MDEQDVRLPAYQAAHPEFKSALQVFCNLSPLQFLTAVRYAVELRQSIEQSAHVAASSHYRLMKDKES